MSRNKHLMHGWFCARASLIGLLFKATLAISLSLEAPKGSSMQPVSMWECKQVPDVHHQTDTNERESLVQVTKVVTMANKQIANNHEDSLSLMILLYHSPVSLTSLTRCRSIFHSFVKSCFPRLHRGTFHHGFHKDFIREIPRVTNLVHFYVFWCLLTANLACNLLCQISWGCSAGSCTLSVEIRYVRFDSGETFGQNLASGKTAFSNHFCGCHQMEWRGV